MFLTSCLEELKCFVQEDLPKLRKDIITSISNTCSYVIKCIESLVERIKSILGLETKKTPTQPSQPSKDLLRMIKRPEVEDVRKKSENVSKMVLVLVRN